MGRRRSKLASLSTNVAILVFGVLVLALSYSLVTRLLAPGVDPVREENTGALVGEIIQVEVRNGCGVSGLAAAATLFLREHGFDVVEVGDHETFDVALSKVIDRVGDLASARKVASALGIPDERVEQDIRPEYYLDASIIIGRDYETLRPFSN
jgi:hypothetical protein